MQLTPNIYIETGFSGANIGLISTDDGAVMIDTPYHPTDVLAWKKAIEGRGQLRYIINTEPHNDHYAGAFFFDVPAVAHEVARETMLNDDVQRFFDTIAEDDPEGLKLIEGYRIKIPAITFSERLTLHLGQHSIQLLHMPGHTLGQLAAFIPEERVVFTGDNVTYKIVGFLHNADPFAWLESLERLKELDFDYIVPGHGEPCGKDYIAEEAAYVQGCIDVVQDAVNKGWTKEEAIAGVSFPTPYPHDAGTESFAEMLEKWSIGDLYEKFTR